MKLNNFHFSRFTFHIYVTFPSHSTIQFQIPATNLPVCRYNHWDRNLADTAHTLCTLNRRASIAILLSNHESHSLMEIPLARRVCMSYQIPYRPGKFLCSYTLLYLLRSVLVRSPA